MTEKGVAGAQGFVPPTRDLTELATAARGCRGCGLYRDASQTVFGVGRTTARMVLVGEQPGDREDRTGTPFVGPAGHMLDRALVAAGIGRDTVYLTNAVKHFKFSGAERGKRRIHKTPSRTEIVACRPWLLAELTAVEPEVVVALGATAAKSLLGDDFRLTQHRGEVLGPPQFHSPTDAALVATVHPSSVLRGPTDRRDEALSGLVDDLKVAGSLCTTGTMR